MASTVLTSTTIEGLKHVAHGKVRDLYEVDENTLLFVASDRISAYDVIMQNVCCIFPYLLPLRNHKLSVYRASQTKARFLPYYLPTGFQFSKL